MAYGDLGLPLKATIVEVESRAISRVLQLHAEKSGMSSFAAARKLDDDVTLIDA